MCCAEGGLPKVDREASLKALFGTMDDENLGYLSVEDYRHMAMLAEKDGILVEVMHLLEAAKKKENKVVLEDFIKYNKEHTGSMNDEMFLGQAGQWAKFVTERGSHTRDHMLDQVFSWCDDDESGFLTFDEFMQLSDNENDKKTIQNMKAVFDAADSIGQKDGKVTRDEFVKYNLEKSKDMSDADFKKQAGSWLVNAKKHDVKSREKMLQTTFKLFNQNAKSITYDDCVQYGIQCGKEVHEVMKDIQYEADRDDKSYYAPEEEDFIKYNMKVGELLDYAGFKAKHLDSWMLVAQKRDEK